MNGTIVWGWSGAAAHAFCAVDGRTGGSLCGLVRVAGCVGEPAQGRCKRCERALELQGLTPRPPAVAQRGSS